MCVKYMFSLSLWYISINKGHFFFYFAYPLTAASIKLDSNMCFLTAASYMHGCLFQCKHWLINMQCSNTPIFVQIIIVFRQFPGLLVKKNNKSAMVSWKKWPKISDLTELLSFCHQHRRSKEHLRWVIIHFYSTFFFFKGVNFGILNCHLTLEKCW